MKINLFTEFDGDGWKSIRRYSTEIHKSLQVLFPQDQVSLIHPPNEVYRLSAAFGRRVFYPLYAKMRQGEINHIMDQSYGNLVHFLKKERTVITCHDLEFWRKRSRRNKIIRRHVLEGMKRAACVVCVSHAVRDELLSQWPDGAEKTRVVYSGVAESFRPLSDGGEREKLRGEIGLRDKCVILHVGNASLERKNLRFLFPVLKELERRGLPWHFVQVGGHFRNEDRGLIERLGFMGKVAQYSHVDEETLVRWYQIADALVIPSTYEGFGFPLMEAMACGLPVLGSQIDVFREVLGSSDGPLPFNEKIWADRLEAIWLKKNLRAELGDLGLLRASQFSYRQTAQELHRIYTGVLKDP